MSSSQDRRRVVVGYDGSAASYLALDWALAEGRTSRRPVHAILALGHGFTHAPGIPGPDAWPENLSEASLARARARAAETDPDVPFTASAMVGSPAGCLVETSAESDLVVVGHEHQSVGGELFFGSTSSQVAGHARCAVAVVDEGTKAAPAGPVVVGVDGSPPNEAALAYAFERAAAHGTHLIAVLAWWWDVPDRIGQAWLGEDSITRFAESQARRLADILSGWTAKFPGVDVLSVIEQARPVDAILSAASGAESIVVGSRGHGGFTGLLLGSTGQGLLHHARPCPLIVVHPQD
jgi:nucleotide-binding universal stress UspA family protein